MITLIVIGAALLVVGLAPKIADGILSVLTRRAPEVDDEERLVGPAGRDSCVGDGHPSSSPTLARQPQPTAYQLAEMRRLIDEHTPKDGAS